MPSPSLAEMQRLFADAVFGEAAAVQALFDTPPARLEVYRRSVLGNYRTALAAVYPVVQRLTGERFFTQAATRFARRVASRSGDLHRYGAAFPGFLARYAPARELVWLADVARLEWQWHRAFHASDAGAPALDALSTVATEDYPRLIFRLQPACRLLRSRYPVHLIWAQHQPERAEPEEIRLDQGPAHLIVCRADTQVRVVPVDAATYHLAKAIRRGGTFGDAADAALAADDAADIGAALARLIAEGVITGYRIARAPAA